MSSFYDTLAWSLPRSHDFRRYLDDCTVFFVQNVADYAFQAMHDAKHWKLSDIPSLMPPISPMFLEYRLPEGVSDAGRRHVGVHIKAVDVSQADNLRPEFAEFAKQKHARWLVGVITVVEDARDHIMPLGSVFIPVDKDGVGDAAMTISGLTTYGGDEPEGLDEMRALSEKLAWQYSLPALLAIGFMHCKNVTVTEQRPPDWQQKAALKKHGRPLVTYHVLNIEPMRTVLRTEGDIEHNGLKKALHICRGHFKTFTMDKPLFGKVTGTYWWQPHVRGSIDEGVALKDYNVRAPKSNGS